MEFVKSKYEVTSACVMILAVSTVTCRYFRIFNKVIIRTSTLAFDMVLKGQCIIKFHSQMLYTFRQFMVEPYILIFLGPTSSVGLH